MKGILPDVHMGGYVEYLIREMQSDYWAEFWSNLELSLVTFADVGLTETSTDLEIWQICQAEQLIFITDNRNADTEDSFAIAIQEHNTPDALPIFTIGELSRFAKNKSYALEVVEQLYDYLIDIDRYRGAGRLYLP